ncbi:MAG TPA: methyltransferase domain-containing protein, partial [Thermomicrobiales bacterium]|nr:methyltransferase domain-containing protein [Thermomicrobiales bacterium]
MSAAPLVAPQATPDDLGDRVFAALVQTLELFCLYVGDQLGFYQALHAGGPATSTELAARAGTNERATREWLEQQATAGFLVCANPEQDAAERRYTLPDGYAAVLVDRDSLRFVPPMAQITAGAVAPLRQLLAAFRADGGVPYAAYGHDLHAGQAGMTRPLFVQQLAQEWIPAMPDIDVRLRADPPARVADIGMGQGWSSIALARGYPKIAVDGFDLDEASVAAAQRNAREAGLDDRVRFQVRDAGDPALAGRYDLALAVECIHDMADPVSVLGSMQRLVGPGGTVLIVDERVPDAFAPNGDMVERVMYGFSVLHCLPVGLADQPSAETGAVMRRPTFRRYAAEAGFQAVEELPIAHDF